MDYANMLYRKLRDRGIRVVLDERDEKLGYRLRNTQVKKIPYTIVIGDNERDNKTVTYRKYGTQAQITVSIDEFVKLIKEEIDSKARLN